MLRDFEVIFSFFSVRKFSLTQLAASVRGLASYASPLLVVSHPMRLPNITKARTKSWRQFYFKLAVAHNLLSAVLFVNAAKHKGGVPLAGGPGSPPKR